MKNRYWISWVCEESDHRPMMCPPNEAIIGWWCSGYDSEDNAILCALVDADAPEKATVAIVKEWPELKKAIKRQGWSWRFFQHNKGSDWLPGDRFPLSDWMIERANATVQAVSVSLKKQELVIDLEEQAIRQSYSVVSDPSWRLMKLHKGQWLVSYYCSDEAGAYRMLEKCVARDIKWSQMSDDERISSILRNTQTTGGVS